METRVAVIGIIVENKGSVDALNAVLSEYGELLKEIRSRVQNGA